MQVLKKYSEKYFWLIILQYLQCNYFHNKAFMIIYNKLQDQLVQEANESISGLLYYDICSVITFKQSIYDNL
jgi:hypothetical protein